MARTKNSYYAKQAAEKLAAGVTKKPYQPATVTGRRCEKRTGLSSRQLLFKRKLSESGEQISGFLVKDQEESVNRIIKEEAPSPSEMYNDHSTDVVIYSFREDAVPIRAHVNVLTRKAYFLDLFGTSVVPCLMENGHIVVVLDLDNDVIKYCVMWIYGVEVDYHELHDRVGDLYIAANFLGLSGLECKISNAVLSMCRLSAFSGPLWMFVALFSYFGVEPLGLSAKTSVVTSVMTVEESIMAAIIMTIKNSSKATRMMSSPDALEVFKTASPECCRALAVAFL